MLKSHYQLVFWGKCPWSLLHALLWRKKGRDVLVIDDPRLATRASFGPTLSALELSCLADLGQRFGVELLGDLAPFLQVTALRVHTEKLHWTTGQSVRDNLRELLRKIPRFQTPTLLAALESSALEEDYRLAVSQYLVWFRSEGVRRSRTAPYRLSKVAWLQELQELAEAELQESATGTASTPLKELVTALYAVLGQVVKYGVGSEESAALMLRLLSPTYRLDQRWFEREILRELQAQGGHFKHTSVQSWQDWQGKLDALLLDSYEGVLTFERLLVYGDPPPTAELQLHFGEKVYRAVCFEFTLDDEGEGSAHTIPHELLAHTGQTMLGTDMPVVLFERTGTRVQARVLVLERPAAKVEFYVAETRELVQAILHERGPWSASTLGEVRPDTSWDLWVEENSLRPLPRLHQRRAIHLARPLEGRALEGAGHWGQLIGQRFGATGYLTELLWDLS